MPLAKAYSDTMYRQSRSNVLDHFVEQDESTFITVLDAVEYAEMKEGVELAAIRGIAAFGRGKFEPRPVIATMTISCQLHPRSHGSVARGCAECKT